ncbi:hypothetical protein ABE142_17300 [Paenibacillus alvei]|nr:hypothetical protein [Paenibacillus alvei]NEZ45183.1 hypothetical protein [Paenibacillus alvei]
MMNTNSNKLIVATIAASVMLTGLTTLPPYHTAYASQQKNQENKKLPSTIAELDPKLLHKIKEELKTLIPKKTIELTALHTVKEKEYSWLRPNEILLESKDKRANVQITNDVSYHIEIEWKELEASLQSTIQKALKNVDPKRKFVIKKVERYKDNSVNYWAFRGEGFSGSIDAITGKPNRTTIDFQLANIDPKWSSLAKETIVSLSDGKHKKLSDKVEVSIARKDENRKTARFRVDFTPYEINIDTASCRLLSFSLPGFNDHIPEEILNKVFAKSLYSNEEALAAAAPIAKQYFHIDLEGYQVIVKYNVYTFTKNGSPTVTGSIDDKGKFVGMSISVPSGS